MTTTKPKARTNRAGSPNSNKTAKPQRPASRNPQDHPFHKKLTKAPIATERRMLIYGASGAGKTTLIGSAAFDERTSPALVLDFDGGGSSLSGLDPEKLSYVRIRDWDDYTQAYDYLMNSDHPYKLVAIDSLSETHVYALLNVVDHEVQKRDRRDDNLEVEQGDYGKALVQMRRFLNAWKVLPLHCIFTALVKTEVAPKEGRVAKPALFGQFADEVVGMFDVTGYLALEEVKTRKDQSEKRRVLTLQNTPGVRAKVRTPFGEVLPQDEISLDLTGGITTLFDFLKVPADTHGK